MISLIIPLHNEESCFSELTNRVEEVLSNMDESWEVILIDDGSSDETYNSIIEKNKSNHHFKGVILSKNFGHEPAISAGLPYAQGDLIIIMDGDLQDPPELIPSIINKLRKESLDVVTALKRSRKERLLRKVLFDSFYNFIQKVSYVEIKKGEGAFSGITKRVRDSLIKLPERNRYVAGMRKWVGFNHGEIYFDRPERFSGNPQQSLRRLFSMGKDAVFSFSKFPTRMIFIIGMIGILGGVGIAINVIIQRYILHTAILGWPSTLLSIVFFGSLNLISIGIMGEYMLRIYDEVRNRPLFIVKEKVGDISEP